MAMVGIAVGVGFVAMVLAPCAIGLYSRLGSQSESNQTAIIPVVPESSLQPFPPRPEPSNLHVLRPTGPKYPVTPPSLQEIAHRLAVQARAAQAAAAVAQADALVAASLLAAKRAESAAKLAEAAQLELARATYAAATAEAIKARGKQAEGAMGERDYLPADHPSLDFPRSRVPSRRVA